MTEYGLERGEKGTQREVCGAVGHPKVRVRLHMGWAGSPFGCLFSMIPQEHAGRCGGSSGFCQSHLLLRSA